MSTTGSLEPMVSTRKKSDLMLPAQNRQPVMRNKKKMDLKVKQNVLCVWVAD